MKITKDKAKALISQGPKNALIFGSGHDLFSMKDYLSWGSVIGLTEKDISHLEMTHRSDGSHKGSIFINGELVTEMTAIDNKDMLMWMANTIQADISSANSIMGRGTWARAVNGMIYQKLAEIAELSKDEVVELQLQGKKDEEE